MPTSKYPPEVRERATRLALEARRDPETRNGAIARIAEQTNVNKEALRNWVKKAEAANLPVETEDVQARIRRLEKENRELRKSNDILRSATAFFGKAEFDRLQK
jgi:transposase